MASLPGIDIRRPARTEDRLARMREDVRDGLGRRPYALPPKYFYDARGSALFEEITRLPEYYLTGAERSILRRIAPSLAGEGPPTALVEFGSGSSGKTELLLEAFEASGRLRGYAPIDVDGDALERAAERLRERFPGLAIVGTAGDFQSELELPFGDGPRLVLFLGSTIGNLRPAQAAAFLRGVRRRLGPHDAFLVGFDLVKDRGRLVAAYDDARGVTAEFNRNVLRVLNRELGAGFEPAAWSHRAVWNEAAARIEMHLVADSARVVPIQALGLEVPFEAGESICTELSHKYTRESAGELLGGAGFRVERWEMDGASLFAVALARPD